MRYIHIRPDTSIDLQDLSTSAHHAAKTNCTLLTIIRRILQI
jgi:hypothetical protein